MCNCLQEITKVDDHIIEYSHVCSSRYDLCVRIKGVCVVYITLGYSSYIPCLRVSMRCLEHIKNVKNVSAASVADYEEGNKAPFCSFESEIEQNRINPEFAQDTQTL